MKHTHPWKNSHGGKTAPSKATCRACLQTKPFSQFSLTPDGLRRLSVCNSCTDHTANAAGPETIQPDEKS